MTSHQLFLKKLAQFDKRLSVKQVGVKWKVYRVGKYVFSVDRLDNRVFDKLRDIDAWRNPNFLRDLDKHNDSLDEAHDRKMERVGEHVADRLTQRHY